MSFDSIFNCRTLPTHCLASRFLYILGSKYIVYNGINGEYLFCRAAKEARKRIWKDYKPSSAVDVKDKSFTAKVRDSP